MPTLATAILRYLHEVLGIEAPGVKPWARANELPYFLRDAFQFSELELLGQPIVLAIGRAEAKQSLSEVRTWLDKVKALAGQPAVYVTDALASYDRRRLIEKKIPAMVELPSHGWRFVEKGQCLHSPLSQNCCRLVRITNPGAIVEERSGEIRTSLQGQSSSAVVAA